MDEPVFFKQARSAISASSLRRVLFTAMLLLGALLGSGCVTGTSELTFASNDSKVEYSQTFTRAFYSHSKSGEYEAVLLEDGFKPTHAGSAGPIVASTAAPLNQTIHIRVLWRPLGGSKPDTPSATNAVIDWHVKTNDAGNADWLHYRGAGFVTIYESGGKASFSIRSAHLELSGSSGRLRDPLGASSLSGQFVAINNSGMVSATVEATSAGTEQTASATTHTAPPPRTPVGP